MFKVKCRFYFWSRKVPEHGVGGWHAVKLCWFPALAIIAPNYQFSILHKQMIHKPKQRPKSYLDARNCCHISGFSIRNTRSTNSLSMRGDQIEYPYHLWPPASRHTCCMVRFAFYLWNLDLFQHNSIASCRRVAAKVKCLALGFSLYGCFGSSTNNVFVANIFCLVSNQLTPMTAIQKNVIIIHTSLMRTWICCKFTAAAVTSTILETRLDLSSLGGANDRAL